MIYHIHRAETKPPLEAAWDDPRWSAAETVELTHFHDAPGVSEHRPVSKAMMLYDDHGLYLRYEVADRWIRSVNEGFQAMVCNDSCVEWFFAPQPGDRYFNLEMNCGGHALCYDCRFKPASNDFDHTPLPTKAMRQLEIHTSLPSRVEPEITEPATWRLGVMLPWAMLREQIDGLAYGPGVTWRGNFYKCGDETSHPHWASWSPVKSEPLTFHYPPSFGELRFV